MRTAPLLLLAAGLAVLGAAARAQESGERDYFSAVFWIDLEPISRAGEPFPLSPQEGAARLLDEAAWVYAGMLFGWDFAYTPLDRTRAIEERFELKALGSIPRGDRRIVPGPASGDSNELRSRVDFLPEPQDLALIQSYSHAPWRPAQGLGSADYMLGQAGRRRAYEDGLREAVRTLLRLTEYNKPRLVRGRVALDRVPTIAISGGRYVVQLRARVEVSEILSYNAY
ncbi:MAG TPA: hypothetical protein VFL04_03880 [Rectinemataceae bacterium]|nr:hypothetical protein [Rectinemataceae bacterium]